MRLARGHNASLDQQLLGLKSSTLPPSHCAPFAVLRKCNVVLLTQLCRIKLFIRNCYLFRLLHFFYFFFTANYVDPASSGSSFAIEPCYKIAAINVAFLHESNAPSLNRMQRAYAATILA